jgi:hypothetical protein
MIGASSRTMGAGGRFVVAERIGVDDADFVHSRFATEFTEHRFFFGVVLGVCEFNEQPEIGEVEPP